jgi:hypothetical protein
MRDILRRPGTRLFLGVLLVYSVCPPFTSNDSYWVVPTALGMLRHGNTALDEYVASAPEVARYALECVSVPCPPGHWHNYYPVGVPVMALPVVAAMQAAVSLLHAVYPEAARLTSRPVVAALLSGDLVGGHALVELAAAALFGALAAWLAFLICAQYLEIRAAVWLALLFAFGTSQWSVASRNLFQHGPSVLALTAALYLCVLAEKRPELIRWAGLPLAIAFTIRPSNFISVLLLTAYVAVRHRRYFLKYLLWTLPVAAPFLADNWIERHSLFPTYYQWGAAGRMPFSFGFWMNLVSPSRGLLIFTPIAAAAVAGMVVAWRRRWCWPLSPFLIAIVVSHMFLISSYWPGHSYGPRYWADISPLFLFFLIPLVAYWQTMSGRPRRAAAALFLTLALWGVFAHGRGATSLAAQQWNMFPVNVDQARERVFDWSDPQFLRGLR